MKKSGFIYIWFDKKHKRYYVGSHWGYEHDGYICSSRWMRKAFRRRPQDFKRRIIDRYIDRREAASLEHRWLQMMKPEELCGPRYYNMCNYRFGHWSSEDSVRKTVGEKISLSHRSDPSWGKWGRGKTLSIETRQKISAGVSAQMTPERRAELSIKSSGFKHTDEARKKIADRSRSKTHICDTCGEYFAPGPFAIHQEWLSRYPVDKYRELREQGLSYRKIAAIHGTDHKNVKKLLEHQR